MVRRSTIVLVVLAMSATSHAEPTRVEKAAIAIVENQLVGLHSPEAFVAGLDPDAVIVGNGSFALARGPTAAGLIATIARYPIIETIVTRLAAGSSGHAMWFDADVALVDGNGCGATYLRLLELATATPTGWRVVALSFVSTSEASAPGDALAPAVGGPLTAYLRSPYALAGALREAPDTIAALDDPEGLGDLALGRDPARAKLEPLRDRDIGVAGAVEVHHDGWGFVAAELAVGADPHQSQTRPGPAQVLLVAIEEHRTWRVVALHALVAKGSLLATTAPPCLGLPFIDLPLYRETIEP